MYDSVTPKQTDIKFEKITGIPMINASELSIIKSTIVLNIPTHKNRVILSFHNFCIILLP